MSLERINSVESLDKLWDDSKSNPVIIFKHSNSCPISSEAYDEVAKLPIDISLVVVQERRDISNAIEEKSGIQHESPQVLILKNGKIVWSASHRKITAESIKKTLLDF